MRHTLMNLGTIQILRNQKGGWVRPNAYVCLQGGWVGVAKCLRNHKNHRKRDFLEKTNLPRRNALQFLSFR